MKNKLWVERLIIKGEKYQRTFWLNHSLVVIKGDGFSGKSLLLKLIAYCLGGKIDLIDLTVQEELNKFCNEVFLEFKISDQTFTVQRNLKGDKNRISIYLCPYQDYLDYSPWKKDADSANEFFAKELQIPLHRILKRKQGTKDLTAEKISFRDIMRFMFINQGELGTISFLKNNNSFIYPKNKEVFKILNDLIIPDLEELNEKIQIVQNEINEREKVINGLENYLENKEAGVLIELVKQKEDYGSQVERLINDKNTLIRQKKSANSDIFLKLKNDLSEIDSSINESTFNVGKIKQSVLNKENLLIDYRREKAKLSATLEAMKKIKITERSESCPLCHSVILVNESVSNCEDIEIALKTIDDKIKTLQMLLQEDNLILFKTSQEITKLNEKKQIYNSALEEYKKNMEVPYLSEIESYNSLIKDINEERNKLNSLIDIHYEKDANDKAIGKLKNELDGYNKRKSELLKTAQREKNIIKKLNIRYRELMMRFNFQDTYEDKCYIDPESYLPHYNGISVLKHTSGCLLLCMQIAYIGAIMELNIVEEQNCHPCFLMIDTVSNNIGTNSQSQDSIDPETYNQIFSYLIELSDNNQIMIVDNTPPQIIKEHAAFVFRRVKKGERLKGFIDSDLNEFVEVAGS